MGNYKSRPNLCCADELKKRISEGYSLVRSRLNDDTKIRYDTQNPFLQACFQGTFEEFASLLTPEHLDERVSPKDFSILHFLCIGIGESQSKKVELLLSKCEDEAKRRALVLQRTPNNYTVLHIATHKGDCSIVSTLLDFGAEVNGFVQNAPSPLHLAAMCGNCEMIELLHFRGADIHSRDFVHFTALHCAAFFSQEKAVKSLLLCGADPNYCGGVHDRPLHIAAGKPNMTTVKLLLDAGADPMMSDDEDNTPVHFAASSGHSAIISAMFAKTEQKQKLAMKTNVYGDTPLHAACYNGKVDSAKLILQYAGNTILRIENAFHETPFHAACTAGKSLDLVSFLIRHPDVDPNFQSQDGHTALHSACYHGHLRIVQHLLDNGADQSLTARAIEPPRSEGRGHVSSTIFALTRLDSGASLCGSSRSSTHSLDDLMPPQQQTPIIWAYEKGHDQIVALLKYYANKCADSDVCSEYSSGDSSYTPLPSPMGRLRSITKEKAEILQLRGDLDSALHLSLMDIELLDAIGSGSFGKVYRGIYRGKTVAVKRYRVLAFGNKSEVDIFCREVTILCGLNHPNVVAFVGACLDDPSQFAIITEYVAAGSLFSLLHDHKLVLDIRLKLCIGVDVARGMRYLHEQAEKTVIHRDLNPHNILLHHNGRAVVADFGESRFATEHEEDNMTKQPGNLRWMAPEVFTQECRYDEKVDVFSYALVVWETHTAELPFSNLRPAAAATEMACNGNRPQLPSVPSLQFPQYILEVISNGWKQNPASRPTFAEILEILEPHVIPDDERNFSLKRISHDDGLSSDEGGEYSEADDQFEPISVSHLKTQWERFSVGGKGKQANGPTNRTPAQSSVVQKLRQRIDTNGYVSQAARSIAAAKSATQFRDTLVLQRNVRIAERQSIFSAPDQQPTGNFTSVVPHSLNNKISPVTISVENDDE